MRRSKGIRKRHGSSLYNSFIVSIRVDTRLAVDGHVGLWAAVAKGVDMVAEHLWMPRQVEGARRCRIRTIWAFSRANAPLGGVVRTSEMAQGMSKQVAKDLYHICERGRDRLGSVHSKSGLPHTRAKEVMYKSAESKVQARYYTRACSTVELRSLSDSSERVQTGKPLASNAS